MQSSHSNRLRHLLVCVLVVVLSIIVEQRIHTQPMGNVLARVPRMVDGLYSAEKSDYLQTITLRGDGTFRWSRPTVLFQLWPAPPVSRIFTLSYIAPTSAVAINTHQQRIGTMPMTTVARTAVVLLPAVTPFDVELRTLMPHHAENESRELGFIFLDATWRTTTDIHFNDVMAWGGLLGGMGLSTVLVMLMMCVIRQPLRRVIMGACAFVMLMWITGIVSPWVAVAMQATIQFILIVGITGVLLHRGGQRFFVLEKHIYLVIFGVWLLSFLCFFSPRINSDGVGYYAYVRSFFIDGDFNFANEFDRTISPFPNTPTFPVYAPTGYTMNPWSIGPAILWTPFWLIGHSLVLLCRGFTQWVSDGYSEPYVVLTCFASSLAGLGSMVTVYALLRRWFAPTIALATSIGVFLGTNMLYYASYEGSYPHSISAFFATLCMLFTMHIYDDEHVTWWHWVRLGITAGVLVLSYWMNVIICLFPVVLLIHRAWRYYAQHNHTHLIAYLRGIGMACVAGLVTLSPQFVVWYAMYGQFFSVYKPEYSTYITIFGTKISAGMLPSENHLIEYFVGPTYGLLWWTPLYVVGLCGSWLFMRINKLVGLWSVIIICFYIFYNATTPNWHGSGAFGMRRMTTLLPFVAIGVAYCFTMVQQVPHLLALLWSGLVGWEIRFMVRYLQYITERGPANFLYDLSASLLSPDIAATESFAYPVKLSWWLGHLMAPNSAGLILMGCIGIGIWGIFLLGKRRFAALS